MISNIAGGILSLRWNLRGPNQTVTSACASATDAIGIAMRLISSGDADIMITGGTEASITPLTIAGFANMRALSQSNVNPEAASRPFDYDRDGFVLSEGSGILVLESKLMQKIRKAGILGLQGMVQVMTLFILLNLLLGMGAYKAMEKAIINANLNKKQIKYINAHGTSTPFNDKNESQAIQNLFQEHSSNIKVSSTKSMTGHLLGAAGGIEAVSLVKAIMSKFYRQRLIMTLRS